MKKALKIIGIVIALLVVLLVTAPFLFKGKIIKMVKNTVNKNIHAEFDFADADISLFRNFPNASVTVEKLSIVNKSPFEGDTLLYAKKATISVPFMQLFNKEGEPYTINTFSIDGAEATVFVDKDGNANYDIAKKTIEKDSPVKTTDTLSVASEGGGKVSLSIKNYEITNSKINYYDQQGKMYFELDDFNHFGSGDLSETTSELKTESSALISFEMDSVRYFNKTPIQLDAVIGIDLEQNKYSFLQNKALINQLELVFDGFVKLNDNHQEVDVHFKTPSSDFKNFLAVIPKEYSKDISNVQTTGNFIVEGQLKGIVDEKHIPTFNISVQSNNASFKYPDLPQAVTNINIDTKIANETGLAEDTFVDIGKMSFKIAQDVFSGNAHIKNLMGNPVVNANLHGRINLTNLSQAYPFPMEEPLKGILDANISTAFDLNSIEKEQYQNTKNSGSLSLKGFEYSSEEMKNTVQIANADVTFNTSNVALNTFEAKTGKTDLSAKGTIQNLLGYVFNKETLKGNFTLNSNTFVVNDFMMETAVAKSEGEKSSEESTSKNEENIKKGSSANKKEQIKIPSFLDATIAAKANTVLYDNLTLKNVSGTLTVKDETVTLENLASHLFGGSLAVNGSVSTKTATPTFNLDLGMTSFNISESFQGLKLLQTITPIANALQGTLNSNFSIKGNLNTDFTPDLASISGNALAEALIKGLDSEKGAFLSTLNDKINFLNLKEGETKDVKTALSFEDGKVKVKPFHIKYKDIDVEIAGSHGFDKSIHYELVFDVPAKYLGDDVNNLIEKLNDPEAKNITVPVKAIVGGTYGSPTVSTDFSSTISQLTQKLIQMQKDKLVNKGTDALKGVLGGLMGGSKTTEKDSTKTTAASSKDSLQTQQKEEDQIKNAANDLINGLFGNKKKKDF